METKSIYTGIGIGVIGILIALVVGVILALPVMLLWNWLMPFIFGLPKLGILKAWGLSVLCGLLFRTVNSSDSKSSN